jgi:hypothetical protein
MWVVLKRMAIAAALVVICVAILAATKAYGVWVITAIAGALFVLGLLRRDEPSGKACEDREDKGNLS